MTKYISKITAIFSLIAIASLTSCSNDDDAAPVAALTVEFTEVGHGGTPPHAHAGEDLHLEAEILAEAKIANVVIEIHSETDASAPEITAAYSDYNGLRNATFHKHVDIPATQPAGIYHLHLTVTDANGQTKTAESNLEILPAETDSSIAIEITELGHGTAGSFHTHVGEEMHVEGTITSEHAIATVVVEIHNESDATAPEIEQTYTNYAGQTNAEFHEHIAIPTNQPTGHYHFHITVTDDEGHSHTEEYELEIE
ncbi:DUF4625 domain-containing protein [Flavobacterium sp. Sd200]|uniref:DUF4625 domain-containing protein n=1 Tax=Flavobacterium sp. Sd200 TaxID=2692211 RepID=UPI001371CCBC|nr:DUF4625 domain-containing protein [Flavobacterium sp. Sd200]MXN93240.1 DUF4625 domain-containing protein [Flavobacterium sp. Sd200]